MAVEDGAAVEWSSEVGAADWIVERLHPFAPAVQFEELRPGPEIERRWRAPWNGMNWTR